MAPKQLIDPSHETCSYVNLPSWSGDSSDFNIANAGAIHPTIQPWFNPIKHAAENTSCEYT